MVEQQFKRNVAYKLKVGQILAGKPILEGEKLKFLEVNNKQIVRTNLVANVIDKYIQEGEKKFGSLTLDDATGQIKLKTFGDDVDKFIDLNQGDTIQVIGMLRTWNNEVYITPEIIKKKDPSYLLVRKLEIETEQPKTKTNTDLMLLKDKILEMIKNAEKEGGIDIEKIILEIKEPANIINQEIKRLLEDGVAYEPRPGKLRWLG
ncbi:MAG: OB-fold nucleic acid binding domain-containing protein [Nanoarchaeota archaeon]